MVNKKYIDKVIDHLVRGTKIDYENERVIFPHFSFLFPHSSLTRPPYVSLSPPQSSLYFFSSSPFAKYCADMFGLTEDEIKYVWNEYKDIMLDKISNREL